MTILKMPNKLHVALEETAFRHGTDGIKFYPPSEWDAQLGTGWTPRYQLAYQSGRQYVRDMTGNYPPTGYSKNDIQ